MKINRCPAISLQYFMNEILDPDVMRRQVREFAQAGYKCVFGHARAGMITPYFSEKWFLAIDAIVDECEKCGIKFAIWDEDYFPSGVAGARVPTEYPQFQAQYLCFEVKEVPAAALVEICWPQGEKFIGCYAVFADGRIEDISQHVGTGVRDCQWRTIWYSGYSRSKKLGAPHWRSRYGEGNGHYYILDYDAPAACKIVAVRGKYAGTNSTDFLNPDAVAKMIELTHEVYFNRYGRETFEKVFAGSFLDEPSLRGFYPWSGNFAAEFMAEHGCDLMQLLPHLIMDISPESREIRRKYRNTERRLVCQSYLRQVQQWCNDHGIESTGHLSRSESLAVSNISWPGEYSCYKYLDLPCTDPLGVNVAWPDVASYHTGIKVVSSVAHLCGKPRAGSDVLAVCGNEADLAQLRYILDYHMVMGVTVFVLHGASQSWAGGRKDEVPPSLYYQHTQWPLFSHLWKRVEESAVRLDQGTFVANVAVYYPGEEFFTRLPDEDLQKKEDEFHDLSEALVSRQTEFDLIDGETLLEQDPAEFVRKYPYFVMPGKSWFIMPGVEEALAKYTACGGVVVEPDSLDKLPRVDLAGEGSRDIFIHRRKLADGRIDAFLFNRSGKSFAGTLDGVPVEVPPRSGVFADEATPLPEYREVLRLNRWHLSFPENYGQLCCWEYGVNLVVDLMTQGERHESERGFFTCNFLYQGEVGKVALLLDDDLAADVKKCPVYLNDTLLTNDVITRIYDEKNHLYDISQLIRTGSVPTLNVVRIECKMLCEMAYLVGDFKVKFPYGNCGLPVFTGASTEMDIEFPVDWAMLGYPAYSGVGTYNTGFEISEDGKYVFDAGEVASALELILDGEPAAVVFNPPYRVELGELRAGRHTLTLKVYNAPANRDKHTCQPAGLFGPCRIGKL